MWPGQQPPGGEQNPQDQNQNPYQQPGYQQPNPYQQPGYQQQGQPGQQGYPQPNPYQQPTVPQYAVPGGPGGNGGPGPEDKKKTTVVAIVAATAVVVAAAVTGVVVMNKDDDKKSSTNVADSKASPSVKPSVKPSGAASSPAANPRGGEEAKPSVPGWKVVTNPKWGTQFDVPGDWEVAGAGVFSGFEDEKKGDGSPAVGFSAPAHYKSKWCVDDADKDGNKEDTGLAGVGTKGARGAKSAAEAARAEAGNWVWGPYAQTDPKEKIKVSKAKPYTTQSGLSGSVATATATGLAKKDKCDTDGKSIAFTFKNGKNEFASWVLYANTGIDDELPDATIQKILSTVRLAEAAAS